MDSLYARADSDRACSLLTAITEFSRESDGNSKDFWARFTRCASKLAALSIPMAEQVIFNRSTQSMRLPEGKLPIVLSAIETRAIRFSADASKDITIIAYETHRPKTDTTEVYNSDMGQNQNTSTTVEPIPAEDDEMEDDWGDSMSFAMGDESVFLTKPKKPTKARNSPRNERVCKESSCKHL